MADSKRTIFLYGNKLYEIADDAFIERELTNNETILIDGDIVRILQQTENISSISKLPSTSSDQTSSRLQIINKILDSLILSQKADTIPEKENSSMQKEESFFQKEHSLSVIEEPGTQKTDTIAEKESLSMQKENSSLQNEENSTHIKRILPLIEEPGIEITEEMLIFNSFKDNLTKEIKSLKAQALNVDIPHQIMGVELDLLLEMFAAVEKHIASLSNETCFIVTSADEMVLSLLNIIMKEFSEHHANYEELLQDVNYIISEKLDIETMKTRQYLSENMQDTKYLKYPEESPSKPGLDDIEQIEPTTDDVYIPEKINIESDDTSGIHSLQKLFKSIKEFTERVLTEEANKDMFAVNPTETENKSEITDRVLTEEASKNKPTVTPTETENKSEITEQVLTEDANKAERVLIENVNKNKPAITPTENENKSELTKQVLIEDANKNKSTAILTETENKSELAERVLIENVNKNKPVVTLTETENKSDLTERVLSKDANKIKPNVIPSEIENKSELDDKIIIQKEPVKKSKKHKRKKRKFQKGDTDKKPKLIVEPECPLGRIDKASLTKMASYLLKLSEAPRSVSTIIAQNEAVASLMLSADTLEEKIHILRSQNVQSNKPKVSRPNPLVLSKMIDQNILPSNYLPDNHQLSEGAVMNVFHLSTRTKKPQHYPDKGPVCYPFKCPKIKDKKQADNKVIPVRSADEEKLHNIEYWKNTFAFAIYVDNALKCSIKQIKKREDPLRFYLHENMAILSVSLQQTHSKKYKISIHTLSRIFSNLLTDIYIRKPDYYRRVCDDSVNFPEEFSDLSSFKTNSTDELLRNDLLITDMKLLVLADSNTLPCIDTTKIVEVQPLKTKSKLEDIAESSDIQETISLNESRSNTKKKYISNFKSESTHFFKVSRKTLFPNHIFNKSRNPQNFTDAADKMDDIVEAFQTFVTLFFYPSDKCPLEYANDYCLMEDSVVHVLLAEVDITNATFIVAVDKEKALNYSHRNNIEGHIPIFGNMTNFELLGEIWCNYFLRYNNCMVEINDKMMQTFKAAIAVHEREALYSQEKLLFNEKHPYLVSDEVLSMYLDRLEKETPINIKYRLNKSLLLDTLMELFETLRRYVDFCYMSAMNVKLYQINMTLILDIKWVTQSILPHLSTHLARQLMNAEENKTNFNFKYVLALIYAKESMRYTYLLSINLLKMCLVNENFWRKYLFSLKNYYFPNNVFQKQSYPVLLGPREACKHGFRYPEDLVPEKFPFRVFCKHTGFHPAAIKLTKSGLEVVCKDGCYLEYSSVHTFLILCPDGCAYVLDECKMMDYCDILVES